MKHRNEAGGESPESHAHDRHAPGAFPRSPEPAARAPQRPRWLIAVVALFHVLPALAQTAAASMPVASIDELQSRWLRAPADFQVTPHGISLAELAPADFRPLGDDDINRGITSADHWVRVRLSNAVGDTAQSWVLRHETSYLDRMTIYYADNGRPLQRVALSDRVPFDERPLDYRTLAFAHTTPAGGFTDLYVRLGFDKADSLTLNLRLTRDDLFHAQARRESLIYGGFYGVMAAFLLIAVVFSAIMRESVYLYYAAFLAASMLNWALLNGFAFQYLWPQSVYLQNEGFHIVFLLTAITALQFSRGFLQTAHHFPRVNGWMHAAQWVMVGGIVLRLTGVYVPVLVISYCALMILVLLSALGLMAWRRGMRYARWYSIAWLFFGVGLGLSVVSAGTSVLEWGMKSLDYAQAGSIVEAAFLLTSLGDRLVGWDRARRRALAAANQDPLTGLGNRRALDDAFDRLETRVRTTGVPVFLAFVDLDHFKAINDRHGHEAGDAVLMHLGRLLESACRPEDVCVRYGGEEFAILLEAPHLSHALEVTERVRSRFSQEPTRFRDSDIEHTLTAGITLAVSAESDPDRLEAIRRADAALYDGKRQGRNRCVCFTRLDPTPSPSPGQTQHDYP